MKRSIFITMVLCVLLTTASCQEAYSPWGIWNDYPLGPEVRIQKTSYGAFYQNGFDGLWILENYKENYPDGERIPVFVSSGEYLQIEGYTKIPGGYSFIIMGEGMKKDPRSGKVVWQKYTKVSINMYFFSEDECKFSYQTKEDANGFSISFLIRDDVIYKRTRAPSN